MNDEAAVKKLGGEAEGGIDVFFLKEGILAQQFFAAFAGAQELQQCLNREAMPANHRLSATDRRVSGNALRQLHGHN